jgi:hypothetical protein
MEVFHILLIQVDLPQSTTSLRSVGGRRAGAAEERPDGDFGMMDFAMLALGIVLFVLFLGYAPLCDKM